MNYNNSITLIGNLANEVNQVTSSNGKQFVSFSIYTADRYKDSNEQWQQLDSIRHQVICFSPYAMAQLKAFKQGARIKVVGSIQYRPFEVTLDNGTTVTKYEATIVTKKVESAALVPKAKEALAG